MLVCMPVLSQQPTEKQIVLSKAREIVFSSPGDAINIINYLSKKAELVEEKAYLQVLLADAYYTKGEYDKSVNCLFDNAVQYNKISDTLKSEILFRKLHLAGKLHLYNQFKDYYKEIEELLPVIDKNRAIARLGLERIQVSIGQEKYQEALRLTDSIQKSLPQEFIKSNYNLKQAYAINQGNIFLKLEEYDAADRFFNQAALDFTNSGNTNLIFKSAIYSGIAQLSYNNGNYDKAISILKVLLKDAELIGNIFMQEKLNAQLALNYLALNNRKEHERYNDKFMELNSEVNIKETATYNTFYDLISREQEAELSHTENRLKLYMYIAGAVLLLLITAGNILYFINESRKKQLREIIGYLEVPNKVLVKAYPEKSDTAKKFTIPTETEQAILAKLKKFESSTRFTSKEMSLSTLSAQLDVNTKYLSEIINKHYNDNFNTYINKLRVNYIIEKLKNEPEYLNYKISYLAEESGFSSHSSFATVFKAITGIAPTVFIDLLGKEINNKKA